MIRHIVAALLLASCADISDEWTPDLELWAYAQEASATWCEASEGECCPVIVPSGGSPIMFGDLGNGRYGQYHDDRVSTETRFIMIDRSRRMYMPDGTLATETDQIVNTLVHEFGHSCGLDDTDEPERVMTSPTGVLWPVSKRDVEEL